MEDFFVLNAGPACAHALRDTGLSSNPGGDSPNLLLMDGPEHRRLRAVVTEVIALVEPLSAALCAEIEEITSALADRAEFDLVGDFACPIAALVTTATLGVTDTLSARLLTSLSETAANLDVWSGAPAGADLAALRVAMFFLKATTVDGGGLALLREAADTGRITEDELMLTPVMLAHAAYENSMNFLALAGLQLLRTRTLPEVRTLIHQVAPTRFAARRATTPVTLSGRDLTEGDRLAIPLGPGTDLAFGLGRHACPGSKVAVAEGEVALRALAAVLTPDHTEGEVEYKTHPVFHGLSRATVTR